MFKDIRNNQNLKTYLDQLVEAKARLKYIESYTNPEKDRIIIESHALQIRKLIELMAFSLMAIHHSKYKGYRKNAGKDYTTDWNGRDIITNILNINPDMFFKACEKYPKIQDDGTKQIQLKPDTEYFSLKKLSKLYDRCGGILHIENPWKNSNKVEQFHKELPSIIKKLKNTFQDHAVLVNHWEEKQSTVLIFTFGEDHERPTYSLAHGAGNFAFGPA